MRARSLWLGGALALGVCSWPVARAQTAAQTPSQTPAQSQQQTQPSQSEIIQRAQQMWRQAAEQGVNFDNGPCLGTVTQGWVADVVHVPRSPVDNQPQNQCEAYRKGIAEHFVELDTHGGVVSVH